MLPSARCPGPARPTCASSCAAGGAAGSTGSRGAWGRSPWRRAGVAAGSGPGSRGSLVGPRHRGGIGFGPISGGEPRGSSRRDVDPPSQHDARGCPGGALSAGGRVWHGAVAARVESGLGAAGLGSAWLRRGRRPRRGRSPASESLASVAGDRRPRRLVAGVAAARRPGCDRRRRLTAASRAARPVAWGSRSLQPRHDRAWRRRSTSRHR